MWAVICGDTVTHMHTHTMDGKLTNLPISHDIFLGNNQYNVVFTINSNCEIQHLWNIVITGFCHDKLCNV